MFSTYVPVFLVVAQEPTNNDLKRLGKPNQTEHAKQFGYTNLTQAWDTYLKLKKIARKRFIDVTLSRKQINSYIETSTYTKEDTQIAEPVEQGYLAFCNILSKLRDSR